MNLQFVLGKLQTFQPSLLSPMKWIGPTGRWVAQGGWEGQAWLQHALCGDETHRVRGPTGPVPQMASKCSSASLSYVRRLECLCSRTLFVFAPVVWWWSAPCGPASAPTTPGRYQCWEDKVLWFASSSRTCLPLPGSVCPQPIHWVSFCTPCLGLNGPFSH